MTGPRYAYEDPATLQGLAEVYLPIIARHQAHERGDHTLCHAETCDVARDADAVREAS